jgi:serine phosphatase RsbU (regulator of sigma subunit)
MNDLSALRSTIRSSSAFCNLSEEDLTYLIEVGELRTYEPGTVIMVQGEEAHDAGLILSGEVSIITDGPRGPIPVATLGAPSLVGEVGALAHLPRSATVRARTAVTLLRIGRSALAEIARTTPSILIDAIGNLGERLRRVNGAIAIYTHALEALERHELDRALLDELRHPVPDLADFGQTFGRMADEIMLRRQRSDDMASAAVIQRALLPRPEAFAAETKLDASASMTAARDVGGDWFELIPLNDGRVAVGVGDVCGKGVPAALFTGITKTLIRINLREKPDLVEAILKANAYLANNNAAELFATILYAAFDPTTGDTELVSCGHHPALIRRASGAIEAPCGGGLPVGMFEGLKPRMHRTRLDKGDLLFLYTDGVSEAEDESETEFGEERLAFLIAQGEPCHAAQWIARVEDAVRRHAGRRPQFDDITCVALVG